MLKWNIVVDSSCDLFPKQISEDINLAIAPLSIDIGDKHFEDNETLNVMDMMEALRHHKGKSGSACPSPGKFAEEFEKAENSICICMTSALSGTYNSAVQGMNIVKETHPDKNIFVLDTRRTSGCMSLVIDKTVELIEKGLSFDEVSAGIAEYCPTTQLFFSLSSFDNLINNGRMTRSAAVIATVLGIRPVALATPEGEIKVTDKPRGEKAAVAKLVANMKAAKDLNGIKIIISHCFNLEGATAVKNLLLEVAKPLEIIIRENRGLTSYYADRKGLLIAF